MTGCHQRLVAQSGISRQRSRNMHDPATILIGVLNRKICGSIPTVTHAFMVGLGEKYRFVGFQNNRVAGRRPER